MDAAFADLLKDIRELQVEVFWPNPTSPMLSRIDNIIAHLAALRTMATTSHAQMVSALQSILQQDLVILAKVSSLTTTTPASTPSPSTDLMPLPMCVVELIPQMRPFKF
jgi:hypothetical protein